MNAAVRYLSKHGNTEKIAKAIATGAKAKAVSIKDEPELQEHFDILFLGGAPYANIMDPALRIYAENLDKTKVEQVILFTTSNWSKRTVNSLRKTLTEKGVKVKEDYFFAWSMKIDDNIDKARNFGRINTLKA